MKPTPPTGPQGIGRYARRPGTRPTYSRAQTDRYKSDPARRERGRELLRRWDSVVREVPVSAEITQYLFVSQSESPEGFWTVTLNRSALPTPPLPPLPGDPPQTGGGTGGGGGAGGGTVYAASSQGSGLPPGLTIVVDQISVNGISFPYPGNEQFNGAPAEVVAPGAATIQAPESLDGLSLAQARAQGKTYLLRHSKIYNLNGETVVLFLAKRVGPPPIPNAIDTNTNPLLRGYSVIPQGDDGMLIGGSGSTPIGTLTRIGSTGGGGGGNPSDPGDPDEPFPIPDLPPPNEEAPPEISCDCPDFTRELAPISDSPYISSQIGRSWADSEAGAPSYCKHCYAVFFREGVPI